MRNVECLDTTPFFPSAFGAPTIFNQSAIAIPQSAIGNRFMFTGREYAQKFGIYEYRARAYHPGLGRFTSEDPMGYAAGDYNLFRYCENDPIDRTDPLGLEFFDDPTGGSPGGFTGGPRTGFYGYTISQTQSVGATIAKTGKGYQIRVKDINVKTKSYYATRAEAYKDGKWVAFERSKENIDRTIKHETDHREKHHEFYNQNHDKWLKQLNDGQMYKDPKAAADALSKTNTEIKKEIRDFGDKDFRHDRSLWPDYKAPKAEQPPDANIVEPQKERVKSTTTPDNSQGQVPGSAGPPYLNNG